MLNRVIGKESREFPELEFKALLKKYKRCVVDLGTGDGKFVYEYAKSHPDTLVIGIDADKQQSEELSRKALKKPAKGGLENVIFFWHSAEERVLELTDIANEIYINFPWGSLLSGVILPSEQILQNIKRMAKPKAKLHIYLTYDRKFEETKIDQLGLPELTLNYLNTDLRQRYQNFGIELQEIRILTSEEKRNLVGSWPKKILSQRDREIYYIEGFLKS